MLAVVEIIPSMRKSQGVFPDGVIVVNEKALEKFLKLTGPIDLLKYDLTIDNDNFNYLTAFNVGGEKRANQAKRVFNDTASMIFEKLASLSENKIEDLLKIAKENSLNKDMLIWLNEEKYESIVVGANWGGEVLAGAPDSDYLSVVATDLSEMGDNSPVARSISKQTEITDRGEVISTVTVERKHSGDELPNGKQKKEIFEYVRLYVPDGSEFISANGAFATITKNGVDYTKGEFKTDQDVVFSERALRVDPESGVQIFQESGKTVFGVWIMVSSGDPASIVFKYKLPFLVKHQDDLSFIFQKQPGVDSGLHFRVFGSGRADDVFAYDGNFSTDLFFNAKNTLFY